MIVQKTRGANQPYMEHGHLPVTNGIEQASYWWVMGNSQINRAIVEC